MSYEYNYPIAGISSLVSAAICSLIFMASSETVMVLMFSVYLTLCGVMGSTLVGLTVTLVPTQLRYND